MQENIVVQSAEDYEKLATKYMNDKYGKAFDDELTIESSYFANALNPVDRFIFKSKNNPGYQIFLVKNPEENEMYSNYNNVAYEPLVKEKFKEISSKFVKDFRLFDSIDVCSISATTDYNTLLEEYMQKEEFSFVLCIPEDSEWSNEEKYKELANNIHNECKKEKINCIRIRFYILTKLFKEEEISLRKFDHKYYDTLKKNIVTFYTGEEKWLDNPRIE